MKKQLKRITITLKSFALFPIGILAILFCCNMTPSVNAKLKYALIANESFQEVSKFELDLYSGHKDLSKATERIWLSVRGIEVNELKNGTYIHSKKNATTRDTFTFLGSQLVNGSEVSITDGSFTLVREKGKLNINYNFTLENGTKITGKYSGKYQYADWRTNRR